MSLRKKLAAVLTGGMLTLAVTVAAPATAAPADPTPGGTATAKSSSGDTRTEQLTKVKPGKQPGRTLSVAPGKTGIGAQYISCWDIWFSGPTFHIICDSDQWISPFVDCSDGFRYWSGIWFIGAWEHFLNCPEGTVAVAGGIYY